MTETYPLSKSLVVRQEAGETYSVAEWPQEFQLGTGLISWLARHPKFADITITLKDRVAGRIYKVMNIDPTLSSLTLRAVGGWNYASGDVDSDILGGVATSHSLLGDREGDTTPETAEE